MPVATAFCMEPELVDGPEFAAPGPDIFRDILKYCDQVLISDVCMTSDFLESSNKLEITTTSSAVPGTAQLGACCTLLQSVSATRPQSSAA